MDFRHLIVTCLFSMLRLSFETQKIKENYAIFSSKKVYLCRLIQLFKPQLLLHYTQTNTVKRNNSN